MILAVGLVVGAASYFYYKHAKRVYQSTTQIYLGAAPKNRRPVKRAAQKDKRPTSPTRWRSSTRSSSNSVRQALRKKDAALVRGTTVRARSPEKSEFITITAEAPDGKGHGAAREYHRAHVHQTPVRKPPAGHRTLDRDRPPPAAQDRSGERAQSGAESGRQQSKAPVVTRAPSASSVLQAAA